MLALKQYTTVLKIFEIPAKILINSNCLLKFKAKPLLNRCVEQLR